MTKYIDVFNGDADGIFSLIQWRRANPLLDGDIQHLITGVKRDIALVSKIDSALAQDAKLTVLDISFDKNSDAVRQILPFCTSLFYCDHHKADTLFTDPKLTVAINTKPTVCTGLLINSVLSKKYPLWAVAAAFGDGLDDIADKCVSQLGLDTTQRNKLKELGVLVNYNGYGSSVEDLHFEPDKLYKQLQVYDTPLDIVADTTSPYQILLQGYETDIAKTRLATPLKHKGLIGYMLDDASWARRISGTFGNQLAMDNPDKPIVIVTKNVATDIVATNGERTYTISLRAPKSNLRGASTICSQFATGGGREGAAGVNQLIESRLGEFLDKVARFYTA